MNISEVRISLCNEDKLKAFASITIEDCFVVRGLKIISGNQGYFVSMPSRRRRNGTYQDIAHPINNDVRKNIEDRVLDAFEKEINFTRSANNNGKNMDEVDQEYDNHQD